MQCLLVEDERQAREGMAALVPWEELGVTSVLTASNGLEALEILRGASPDLIVSDVRMPRLSGVQLLKELRESGRDTPFLFISGFSDKEYLMAAIRYHAVDYLEKPVMIPELTERLRAIIAGICEPRALPSARSLLREGASVPAVFRGAKRYRVAILSLSEDGLRLSPQQLAAAARGLGKRVMQEEETPDRTLFIVAEREEPIDFQSVIDAINRAGGGYALCLSQSCVDFADLPSAYAQADACASRAYTGPLRGLQEFADISEHIENCAIRAESDVRGLIRRRMYPLLPEAAETCARRLRLHPQAGRADALTLFRAILEPIEKCAKELGGQIPAPDTERVYSKPGFDAAVSELRLQVAAFSREALVKGMNAAVGRAVSHIADNLSGQLPVSEIAQSAFVSPSHLNFLFKQDTGVSVKQYSTEMRVERAKLLLEAKGSVLSVAAAVGIRDEMYFSKLFKRETGVSPSEWRG